MGGGEGRGREMRPVAARFAREGRRECRFLQRRDASKPRDFTVVKLYDEIYVCRRGGRRGRRRRRKGGYAHRRTDETTSRRRGSHRCVGLFDVDRCGKAGRRARISRGWISLSIPVSSSIDLPWLRARARAPPYCLITVATGQIGGRSVGSQRCRPVFKQPMGRFRRRATGNQAR